MAKTSEKDISNEELAQMIAKGFANTATRQDFEALNSKIDSLDSKVDKTDDRLRIVETKLDKALYTDNVKLEVRIKRLEDKVGISSKLGNQ